jgi:hypothetical protein
MSHTLGQPKEQKSQKMSKNMSKKKKAPKKGESTAGGATESDATELFDRAQEEWETKANTDQKTAHDNAPRSPDRCRNVSHDQEQRFIFRRHPGDEQRVA